MSAFILFYWSAKPSFFRHAAMSEIDKLISLIFFFFFFSDWDEESNVSIECVLLLMSWSHSVMRNVKFNAFIMLMSWSNSVMRDMKPDILTTLMKIIFALSFLCFNDVSLKWKSASYLFITYFTYMMQKENIKSLIQKVRCSVERKCRKCCVKDKWTC